MSRCPKGYSLLEHRRVWAARVIGGDQSGYVGEHGRLGWFSGQRANVFITSHLEKKLNTTAPDFSTTRDTLPIFREGFKGRNALPSVGFGGGATGRGKMVSSFCKRSFNRVSGPLCGSRLDFLKRLYFLRVGSLSMLL